jgi:hypothetical protein
MGESTMSEILITGPPRIRELVDQLKAKGPILGDTQRTSREAKPSPMERLDAYAKRWNVTLRTEPWGGHGWRVNLTRWIPEQDESVRAEYYGFGDTMSAAIDDVMDAVEGVS